VNNNNSKSGNKNSANTRFINSFNNDSDESDEISSHKSMFLLYTCTGLFLHCLHNLQVAHSSQSTYDRTLFCNHAVSSTPEKEKQLSQPSTRYNHVGNQNRIYSQEDTS
jgi:hypothetical protein